MKTRGAHLLGTTIERESGEADYGTLQEKAYAQEHQRHQEEVQNQETNKGSQTVVGDIK